MRCFVPLVALLLPLAGCLGGEDAPGAASTEVPPSLPGGCAPEADCPVAPGAPAGAAGGTAAAAGTGAAASRPVAAPFSFDGSTGTGLCPSAAVAVRAASHCVFVQDARWSPPEVSVATPLRVLADVEAAQGAAPQRFYLSLVVDAGDGWTWDPEREPSAEGVPPLSVAWDVSGYPPGTRFMFWVEASGGAGPLRYAVDQPYHVEGALWGVGPQ